MVAERDSGAAFIASNTYIARDMRAIAAGLPPSAAGGSGSGGASASASAPGDMVRVSHAAVCSTRTQGLLVAWLRITGHVHD